MFVATVKDAMADIVQFGGDGDSATSIFAVQADHNVCNWRSFTERLSCCFFRSQLALLWGTTGRANLTNRALPARTATCAALVSGREDADCNAG